MEISERTPHFIQTTIAASGTLSSEIDFGGFEPAGLIYSGATNGTLGFQVSHAADANGGVYQDLKVAAGSAAAFGPSAGSGAIDASVLNALRGYRFVKVKMSIAQAGIVTLYFPGRA